MAPKRPTKAAKKAAQAEAADTTTMGNVESQSSISNEGPTSDTYLSDDYSTNYDTSDAEDSSRDHSSKHQQKGHRIARGRLADGTTFAVPETESVLQALLSPKAWMTPFQWLWMGSCILTLSTLFLADTVLPSWFFIAQCIFWRMGYNFGLGYILRHQSHSRWWEKVCNKFVFNSPSLIRLMERCVLFIDPSVKPFKVKDYPKEFSSWLVYRFVVKIILALDVCAYTTLVVYHFRWPTIDGTMSTPLVASPSDISTGLYIRYAAFVILFIFAIWSKSDAHRVLGDYAWYWGDFWFLLEKDLTFDGIFQMFPHPMYTVGYAFIYGCSIASNGFTVFFCSVVSHLLQMYFLAFVENPHIDKTYNVISAPTPKELERDRLLYGDAEKRVNEHGNLVYELPYFARNELVYFRNFDFKRTNDWVLVAFVAYSSMTGLCMGSYTDDFSEYSGWGPISGGLLFCVLQFAIWKVLGTLILMFVLRKQSKDGWWVKLHDGNTHLAFQHWKVLYNFINTMGLASFFILVARCCIQYLLPVEAIAPAVAAGHESIFIKLMNYAMDVTHPTNGGAIAVIGILLILLNVYVSNSVYDAIGFFGYYYGDFFIEHVPTSTLTYSGIYRYMNNPDSSLGFAGYYGLVLICPSHTIWVTLPLAMAAHVMAKLFEKVVEEPHMKRRYDPDEIRKEGGLRSELKKRARGVRTAMKNKKSDIEANIARLQRELREKTAQRDQINTTLKRDKEKGMRRSNSKRQMTTE